MLQAIEEARGGLCMRGSGEIACSSYAERQLAGDVGDMIISRLRRHAEVSAEVWYCTIHAMLARLLVTAISVPELGVYSNHSAISWPFSPACMIGIGLLEPSW